jgi:hypothetical protein
MNRTNRCLSLSSRDTAVWGAHASRVLVAAFCSNELFFFRSSSAHRSNSEVREGRMPLPARYKRALPGTLLTRHLYLSNE